MKMKDARIAAPKLISRINFEKGARSRLPSCDFRENGCTHARTHPLSASSPKLSKRISFVDKDFPSALSNNIIPRHDTAPLRCCSGRAHRNAPNTTSRRLYAIVLNVNARTVQPFCQRRQRLRDALQLRATSDGCSGDGGNHVQLDLNQLGFDICSSTLFFLFLSCSTAAMDLPMPQRAPFTGPGVIAILDQHR